MLNKCQVFSTSSAICRSLLWVGYFYYICQVLPSFIEFTLEGGVRSILLYFCLVLTKISGGENKFVWIVLAIWRGFKGGLLERESYIGKISKLDSWVWLPLWASVSPFKNLSIVDSFKTFYYREFQTFKSTENGIIHLMFPFLCLNSYQWTTN